MAARREQQDRPARRLRDLPPDGGRAGHPRPAGHERVPLQQHAAAAARLAHGFSRGTPVVDPADFGNQGIDPNLESPDIYQYNLTLERELPGDMGLRVSYIGSTMRKLLVDRDYNTLPASTVPFDPEDPADCARLPFPLYGSFMDIVDNRGSGQFNAAQFEAAAPLAGAAWR